MIYGYVRVSTDEQSDSVDAQTARITEYMQSCGLPCGPIYTDEDISAYRIWLRDRPQGRLLCDVLQPGDTVVITAQDRLFRSLADSAIQYERWKNTGIRMYDLSKGRYIDSVDDETMFQLLAVIANDFSRRAGYRIRTINEHKRRAGLPWANCRPLGWMRKNGAYVPCDSERAFAATVVADRESGMTWRAIALAALHARVQKPVRIRGEGHYSVSDMVRLYCAARAGFPKTPRDALRVSAISETPPSPACP